MKTKTIKLYEYNELPEDVKAKVLENERYINVEDHFWHEYMLEEWEDKIETMGFNNPQISYTGFSSQGDGASFTCKDVDVLEFIRSQKAAKKFEMILKGIKAGAIVVNVSVERIDHHYYHENTVRGDVEVLQNSISDKVFNNEFHNNVVSEGGALCALLTETVRSLSKQIYRDLEQEYDALTTDEAIIDTIEANEYTFTITGKMENI